MGRGSSNQRMSFLARRRSSALGRGEEAVDISTSLCEMLNCSSDR
jgi:hypothetical protein